MTAHKSKLKKSARPDRTSDLARLYFLLPAFEALLAIALVFAIPSEGDQTLFLGLSPVRWALVSGLFVLGSTCAVIHWLSSRRHMVWQFVEKIILSSLQHPVVYPLLVALAVLISIASFCLVLLTFKFSDEYVQALMLRVLPLTLWILLVSLQTLILFPLLRFGNRPLSAAKAWLPAFIALGSMVLVVILIVLTGVGLHPDRTGWENPGVPLLGTQIFMAWLGAILLYALTRVLQKRYSLRFSRIDLLAAGVLWLLAILAWQAQPLTPTFFSPTPGPPNTEYYPYSDAANHDLAGQSLLIGEGFTDVAEKPLYSFFLAFIHVIVGQDYANVVAAQIVLLALFPAVLYLLASQMHHRLSGALVAIAIIFREWNTIGLSGEINVSHSKLLMTDLPAAMGMATLCLLLIGWLRSDRRLLSWPLWVGASLGILLLLRSQTIIFLPVLLVLAFWRGGNTLRLRAAYAGLLLLGFALAAAPWMFRNYQHTGQFGYSQPLQALYLAKQYSLTPELEDPGFPEGTLVSEYSSLGFSKVVQFSLSHPGEVVSFVSAHFFHNEVSSLLALPMRYDLADKLVTFYNLRPYWIGVEDRLWSECCSLDAYVAETPYWQNWDGTFPADGWLPLGFNLIAVSIGVLAAWRKIGWLTLVPIGVHVFYNASTAIARVSGWRLILPVDWVLILFYCLGLGQLSLWVWSFFFNKNLSEPIVASKTSKRRQLSWREQKLPVAAAGILVAGLLLPVLEVMVPSRYSDLNASTAAAAWENSALADQSGLNLDAFLQQPDARLLWGQALYPRFYAAGSGEPGGDGSAYNILPYARLAFRVIGPANYQLALPIASAPVFPNAVDVLVLGCEGEKTFQAAAVVLLNSEAADLLAEGQDSFVCAP